MPARNLRLGAALEESFFQVKNTELLDAFRQRLAQQQRKEQLASASGIHDDAVLDRLVASDIRPETLAALTLVPLIEVAWADGRVQSKEHAAVLEAAEQAGIRRNDEAFGLLDAWLAEKPGPDLLETWKQYVAALCESLERDAVERLKHGLLDRARRVAEATGGLLGFGRRVSPEEQAVLEGLERVFG